MSFSPIDKLPLAGFNHGALDRAATDPRGLVAPAATPIDPHLVLALEAWPATGPRLFDSDASRLGAAATEINDPDQSAANVLSFLI
jgi:hypothetical protein